MIAKYQKIMNDDEKGKRFLELIDEQNNLQCSSKWNSVKLKDDLEALVAEHSKITKELNSLDDGVSIL
jgi:hypothetical protein